MKPAFWGLVVAALTAAASAMAAPANLVRATDGYVYFSRVGASPAEHDSELKNCVATWRGGVVIDPAAVRSVPEGQGVVGDAIAGTVTGMMMSGWEKARRAVNIEHCMVVRGWHVVRLPDEEGKILAGLDRATLAERLSPWVGAVAPHGVVARSWANEAARGDSIMAASPQGARQTQLSLLAMDPTAPDPAKRVEARTFPWTPRPPDLKPMTPADLANPPRGAVIIVVKVSRTPGYRNRAFGFDLEGGVGGIQGTEEFFEIGPGHGASNIQAFAVPAGRWRMYGFGLLFDYCMGAPSVRVKPGEVVFFGHFQFNQGRLATDTTLAPAADYLASMNPSLAARLKPAAWVNGDTYPCRLWHPYALELENFPYEPGYEWGGASQSIGRKIN